VTHVFHPDAAVEFEEAVRYYRARGRVLGDRFAAEVRFAIRRILETPERWRVLEEDVRRCLVRVFPYSVLYTIEPDFILIVAVMHGKRQPGYWRYRVGTEVE
jgi:plasmid stabilization system protein ParE